ncbi:PBP1A family penicillin-binding protein [Trichothermofontia sichuanensis B231]|uniref:PBP1A family penicillin-binding protein n=1 Tax=Trichothermofontia sichuanensis TaxID=3045816 RepID=UPI002245B90F|nr:PBP1A family penicillin-binding protein [Trichothermofontia sichuanensis]UZQ55958.1 PBP1A family penicillin-binding protein [Trichothermofontia sichuanensis B231]
MTPTPPPPRKPNPIMTTLTNFVQTVVPGNLSHLKLKPNAQAPELRIDDPQNPGAHSNPYHLVGDYYTGGRSSSCDIKIRNTMVSKRHFTIERDPQRPDWFWIKDEQSQNGLYQGKQRVTRQRLRHGDRFTLGPPDLAEGVTLTYTVPQGGLPPLQTAVLGLTEISQRLKPRARVLKLRVYDPQHPDQHPAPYPLAGDHYTLGRSQPSAASALDIQVQNRLVSECHLTFDRDPQHPNWFWVEDPGSTNGTYRGRRRLTGKHRLRHGDRFTLGPPDLQDVVTLTCFDPYIRVLRYGIYGFTGLSLLLALWIGLEWQKFSVRPLPHSIQGPVIVYARDNVTPLREPYNRAHIEFARLSDFPAYLPNAVIASEDTRFYWHLGVDPIGILRAVVTNLRSGSVQEGGSTVTQQLARSLFRDYVGTADSAGRKIREAIVALQLEMVYSKDFLMRTYLNRVYLGSGSYGFEDAAQFYFGKSARDLTLSEAATLVGILPAPNSFNPIRDYEAAVRVRDRVLSRMLSQGFITEAEAQRARRSRIEINPRAREQLESTIAPYFYDHVFAELERLLGSQLAQEGNFIIETALDPQIQTEAETALKALINTEGAALGFSQGAIATIDTQTGAIMAMVGGVDYADSQFNRATQALRQPGSTFKVLVYAAALEQGMSPSETFSCAPLTWQGQAFSGCQRSRGAVDMYQGMAQSENVVALRIAQAVGLNRVVRLAQRLGIESPLKPVPGLALGQSEVTVLEMTGAVATFANGGVYNRPHAIQRVLDSGDCRDRNDAQSCRVIYDFANTAEANQPGVAAEVATTMTALLQGVVQSGTGRNANIGAGAAGKTGTTNDNVDTWFVGYLPEVAIRDGIPAGIATGIWLGNDDNSPTSGSSAIAAKLWGDYMAQVLARFR